MNDNEKEVSFNEGRGEMKYDVLKEIEQLKKEIFMNPNISKGSKTERERLLIILENRMKKL